MAYDLEEQEQIDAIKAWWKQHGNTVLLGVVVFVAIVSGIQGWRYYQNKQSVQASALFEMLQGASDANKVREVAGQLIEQYPRTGYAARAALLAAKSNYDAGDAKSAKAQLQWGLEHAGSDEVRDVAGLRLAGILLDEKKYGEALKIVEAKHDAAYDGLYADLRGDILLASGKDAEALASYKLALDKIDPTSPYRGLVQMKMDGLGG